MAFIPTSIKSSRVRSSGRGRRTTLFLLTALLGAGALAAGMIAAGVMRRAVTDQMTITPGVVVDSVAVGGLDAATARERIRAQAHAEGERPLTLRASRSGRTWHIPIAEAGARFDVDAALAQALAVRPDDTLWTRLIDGRTERRVAVEMPMTLSRAVLDRRLERIAQQVQVRPRNARGAMDETGHVVVVTPERKGVALDVAATGDAVLQNGAESLRHGGGVAATLVVHESLPAVTGSSLAQIQYPLVVPDPGWPATKQHVFTTYFGSSAPNRRHNIELATAHIDGVILAPGEVFSYNRVVGPRDPDLGFRVAPTYLDGQVVPGPGGGVCQVSTTLYNAVLRAPGLTVVRREHHSMPVHYVPAGCDATVAYDDIDFRFRNDTGGPVLVAARTTGGKLSFGLYGTQPATAQRVIVEAGDRQYAPSGGSFQVRTTRSIVDAAGATHREVLSTDTYQPYIPPSPAASPSPALRPERGTTRASGRSGADATDVVATPSPAATPAVSSPAALPT